MNADATSSEGEAVHPFDRATAVEAMSKSSLPFGAAASGAKGYAVAVDETWWGWREANPGYLAALLLRGMAAAVGGDAGPARSMTVHFSRAARPGPARLFAVNESAQDGLGHVSARLEQDHHSVAVALAAFARSVPGGRDPVATLPDGVDLTPPGADDDAAARRHERPPAYLGHYELRPHASPADTGDASGASWIRFAEPPPRALDALSLSAFTAAWMPGAVVQADRAPATRTLSLSVSFLGVDAAADPEGRCLGIWRAQPAGADLYEQDGELWSPRGRLLARSRLVGRCTTDAAEPRADLRHPAISVEVG